MKLLHLGCHAILEYDELKLFEEMGLDFFALGSYIDPKHPVDPIRPALSYVPDAILYNTAPVREAMPQSFIDNFDTILVMHVPQWITLNWDVLKRKRVIWRTIGQSTGKEERALAPFRKEGLQVLRYSLREKNIPDYIGEDEMIRFYKDENEFGGWTGHEEEMIIFAQNMGVRGEFCNYETFLKVAKGFNAHVYGPKNEMSGELNGGFKTYDELKAKMRSARVYFYTGTQPASYTLNFIEAMMTGIPVVSIGPMLGTSLKLNGDSFEVPDIITNGVNGFWSDDIGELRMHIDRLLKDHNYAQMIGEKGRKRAIQLFGKEQIKNQWRAFLRV